MAVKRTSEGSSTSMVKERWTASSEKELRDLYDDEERNYPSQGYGIMLLNVKRESNGSWTAAFSRYTSCD